MMGKVVQVINRLAPAFMPIESRMQNIVNAAIGLATIMVANDKIFFNFMSRLFWLIKLFSRFYLA